MYVCVHQTDQGIKNLSVQKAGELSMDDPDYSIRDLYESIASGNFVSTARVQYRPACFLPSFPLLCAHVKYMC